MKNKLHLSIFVAYLPKPKVKKNSKISPYKILNLKSEVKNLRLFAVFFILFSVSCFSGFSQNKSKGQIEREKKQNLRKIAETHKILQETSGEKKATMGKLTAISEQITSRKHLIRSIEHELEMMDTEIAELDQISNSIEIDLKNLKKEYSALIYATAKANQGLSKLTFLFSSESFNQLVMRIQYLQQYSKARKVQKEQIEKVQKKLETQRQKRNEKRYEKQMLLQSHDSENKNLIVLKEQHKEVVKQLNDREEELKKEIEEDQKEIDKLDRLMADLIEKEIRKAREEAERIARNSITKKEKSALPEREKPEKNTISLNAEDAILAGSFAELKNKMIWPVKSGFVSRHFGNQPHPVLKGIIIPSNGVNIQTDKDEDVRVVYDGTVKIITTIPGANKMVAVQHGDYFTVYSHLTNVVVRNGQKLKAKDVIGKVSSNGDGVNELQFQIWKNNEKLDPEKWLSDK